MTSAAPQALAVSKHTNPIGPERGGRGREGEGGGGRGREGEGGGGRGREGEGGGGRGREGERRGWNGREGENGRDGDKVREAVGGERGRGKDGGL